MNLPPLPTPLKEVAVAGYHDGTLKDALEDYFDAEQMQTYALDTLKTPVCQIDAMRETYRQAGALANEVEDAHAAGFVAALEWVRARLTP